MFSAFAFLYDVFIVSEISYIHIWLFLNDKKLLCDTFFTQFVLSHASNNTTSPNIGGMDT